jgi:hypothetical protein
MAVVLGRLRRRNPTKGIRYVEGRLLAPGPTPHWPIYLLMIRALTAHAKRMLLFLEKETAHELRDGSAR